MQNLVLENPRNLNSFSSYKTVQQEPTELDRFHISLQDIINSVKENLSSNHQFVTNLVKKLKGEPQAEIKAKQLAAYNFLISRLRKGGVETIAIYNALDQKIGNSLNFTTPEGDTFSNLTPTEFLDKTHEFGLDITLNQNSVIKIGQCFYQLKNFDPIKTTQKSIEITKTPEVTGEINSGEIFWSKLQSSSILHTVFSLILNEAKVIKNSQNTEDLTASINEYFQEKGPFEVAKKISYWVDVLKNNYDKLTIYGAFSDELIFSTKTAEIKATAFGLIKQYLRSPLQDFEQMKQEYPDFTPEEYNSMIEQFVDYQDQGFKPITIEQAITENGLEILENNDYLVCGDSFYLNKKPWSMGDERKHMLTEFKQLNQKSIPYFLAPRIHFPVFGENKKKNIFYVLTSIVRTFEHIKNHKGMSKLQGTTSIEFYNFLKKFDTSGAIKLFNTNPEYAMLGFDCKKSEAFIANIKKFLEKYSQTQIYPYRFVGEAVST